MKQNFLLAFPAQSATQGKRAVRRKHRELKVSALLAMSDLKHLGMEPHAIFFMTLKAFHSSLFSAASFLEEGDFHAWNDAHCPESH